MSSTEEPARALARRLRALRTDRWPELSLTQLQLAEVLGDDGPLSVPLISSWESQRNPKLPPRGRLAAYATFFATDRSVETRPYRRLDTADLTPDERTERLKLLSELASLHAAATEARRTTESSVMRPAPADSRDSLWHFKPGETVNIVDTDLPASYWRDFPYANPNSPDFMEMFRYADPDAVIELYGHIRALNPDSDVHFRTSSMLKTDDYPTHLILLGGVDWNTITRDVLKRINLPVNQAERTEDETAGFVAKVEGENRRFTPKLEETADRAEHLLEDVALFFRAPNPYNANRTLTICNGMYGRGTLGVVRALTDTRFRAGNDRYVQERFSEDDSYGLLTRVPVVNGKALTPDWTDGSSVLYEWPEATD